MPDLGPVPQRLAVSAGTVRRLIRAQFPQWAALPVEPVARSGWDNHTFRLGDQLLIRLPSAEAYALAVEKETRWLPALAPLLSHPIPVPVGRGRPGEGYPYSWSVYEWIEGERAARPSIIDQAAFAADLAGFVLSLRAAPAGDGPRPGLHNWYRGGTLRVYDDTATRAIAELAGRIDGGLVAEAWQAALAARWDGVDTWFHGDLAEGNLLLRDGRLSAVIDFGTCGVGDPACDLAIAWTLLSEVGREVFRTRLAVDEQSWARGAGWALWKCLSGYACAVEDEDEEAAAEQRGVLDQILADHVARAR